MRNKVFIVSFGLIIGFLFFTTSCKKHPENTQTDYNWELISIKEQMYPQQFVNQFMLTFFKAMYDTALINSGESKIDVADVLLTNQNDTLRIQFEYWTNPHKPDIIWHHFDTYHHYRAGTYSFVSDSLFMVSDVGKGNFILNRTFYYDSLIVNLNKFFVSKTGLSSAGNQTYQVVFDNIFMDGSYAKKASCRFNAEFNYEIFKTSTTPYLTPNDYILFSGYIEGTTQTGLQYKTEISQDTARYKIDFRCFYTIEGKSNVNFYGDEYIENNALLDYISEDGCANKYRISFPDKFSTKNTIE